MYFDFDDYRPDTPRVMTAISWREGVLLSIIFHLLMVITSDPVAEVVSGRSQAARARALDARRSSASRTTRSSFSCSRASTRTAPKPPDRADSLGQGSHRAGARSGRPSPRTNRRSRAATRPSASRSCRARPRAATGPHAGPGSRASRRRTRRRRPAAARVAVGAAAPCAAAAADHDRTAPTGAPPTAGGSLGEALKNLQRYVQTYDNPQGGGGQFGPEIQFDTKGVEFGPWIRRFVAQVKRNWFVPYSAMSHERARRHPVQRAQERPITDLAIVGPCPIDAFNSAAYGALASSNPDAAAAARRIRPTRRSLPSRFSTTKRPSRAGPSGRCRSG